MNVHQRIGEEKLLIFLMLSVVITAVTVARIGDRASRRAAFRDKLKASRANSERAIK